MENTMKVSNRKPSAKKVMINDLIDNYYTKVWNLFTKKNEVIGVKSNDDQVYIYHNSVMSSNSYYRNQYLGVNPFSSLDNLLDNRKAANEKDVFKIRSHQGDNELKAVFLPFFMSASEEGKKYIASKISTFISYPHRIVPDILQMCSNKGDKEAAKIFLENLPSSVTVFNHYADLNTIFYGLFKDEEEYNMYLHVISKRADQINRSSYVQDHVKEFLLKKYKEDEEKLEEFSKHLPTLKSYLAGYTGDSIFYEKEENELTLLIDYGKLKGSVDLDTKNPKTYAAWLNSLLQVIAAKEKRVNKIFSDDIKLNNNQTYKQIFVYVKPGEKIDEDAIKNLISKFIVHLNKEVSDNNGDANSRKAFITKWWNMNKLADSLSAKSTDNTIKKHKI